MKTLYNLLFDYAVSTEIVDKNYARLFNVESGYVRSPTCHMAYTSEELDLLWANVDKHPIIDMILIQCYSGWRPGEMCELLMKDIDLERGCMMGGLKTKAGINRTVPIHPRIFHLVKARYEKALAANSPYLFFSIRMKSNGPTRPKGRKTFVTMAKAADVDDFAIKRIVGHYIKDLTERVYTERSLKWLKSEIEKIP